MKKNAKKSKTAQRKKRALSAAEQKKISAGYHIDTAATANSASLFDGASSEKLRRFLDETKG
jgi:hypothetical protein